MNEVAQVIAILFAAAYWGGAVFVDFVVTPARFATAKVERADINAIGRQIFLYTGIVQAGLAVVVLLAALIGGVELVAILIALFLLVLAGMGLAVLFGMDAFRNPSLSPEEIEANKPALQNMHRAATAIDIFKVILGVFLIVILVTQ